MRHVITMLFVLAGVIKVTPVIGVLGAERLQALYQMPFDGLDLLLLMRHRAVLFGVVGGLLLVAAFRPSLRALAGTVGTAFSERAAQRVPLFSSIEGQSACW